MIKLISMEQGEFDTFFEKNIVRYAEENVANRQWQTEDALERLRAEFQSFCQMDWVRRISTS